MTNFQTIIAGDLRDRTVPFTRTDKGLAGNQAPISPWEFKALLQAELKWIRADSFDVGNDPDVAIDMAVADYAYNHWANWVNLPLAGDAPQNVVDWQKQVRAAATAVPAISGAVDVEKRVTLLEAKMAKLVKS